MQITFITDEGTTVEEVTSPEIEAALSKLRDAYVGFPWCTCPDYGKGNQETAYFEHKHDVDHGWECVTCLGVVQVG